MDELVRKAHRELHEEVYRLGLAYQLTVQEAAITYQRGVLAAQQAFESKLNAASLAMQDAVATSLRSVK